MDFDPTQCPHMAGFDPAGADDVADPWQGFRRSREETPVFFMPEHGMWVISRYDDVRAALKDLETFSSAGGHIKLPPIPDKYLDQIPAFPLAEIQLNGMDPPAHTPLRRLSQRAFTPAGAKEREPELRELANRLIDEFIDRGRGDLVTDFTSLFSLYMTASMFGVQPTPELAQKLKQWAYDEVHLAIDPVTDEEIDEMALRAIEFRRFIDGLIEERRREPTGDVVSQLVHARSDDGDEMLTGEQLVAMVTQSLTGGVDTTAGLIARMLFTLLAEPEKWEKVAADPAAYSAAVVEETLRMHGSIRAVGRTATHDVTVAGTTIPKGAFVLLHVGAASRDDSIFEDAEEFKIERPSGELNQHLGLGRGTHFCLGAPFARVGGRVALEEVARRMPDLRLAAWGEAQVNESLFVVVLQRLEAEWTAGQPVSS